MTFVKHVRSPFGELVYQHRRRLSLTQLDVANLSRDVSDSDFQASTISDRRVAAFERKVSDPAQWTAPHPSTLRTLARVFDLEPGSDDHRAFTDAARYVRDVSRRAPPEQPASLQWNVSEQEGSVLRQFVAAGREPHLQRLRQAVSAAAAGTPGVVFVSADPGTGKTWLLEELCREALGIHSHLVTVWGACTARLSGSDPHRPLRQVLEVMVGDLDSANPQLLINDENARRLADRAPHAARAIAADGAALMPRFLRAEALRNEHLRQDADEDLLQCVEAMMQGAARPEEQADTTHEQLFRVLSTYAASGPLILVLEDLHWADDRTAAALMYLLRRLLGQRLPILVLGSFRPGDLEIEHAQHTHPVARIVQESVRMFRDPVLDLSTAVGGAAGRAFIDAMVARPGHALPPESAGVLFEKTGGLPLFVSGILGLYSKDRSPEDSTPTPETWVAQLPAEIETLFNAKVRQLPEHLQRILAGASVQGDTFAAETIMRVFDLSLASWIETVDQQLGRIHRMVSPAGRATIAGSAVHHYQFSHALFRDYIYAGMTDLERAYYHGVTAEALLDLYGDQQHDATDAIAFHFEQASDRARAAPAYVKAGVHALILRDFDRAVRHFEHVEQLGVRRSDPESFALALVGLGNCARGMGNPQKARQTLERAVDLAIQQDLPAVRAHALEALGVLEYDAGNMQAGVDRLSSVIEIWLETGDDDSAARTMANLSNVLYGQGRYEEALSLAERGVALAIRTGDERRWIDAQNAKAICLLDLGMYDEAAVIFNQCIDVCDEIDDTHRENLCLYNVSLCAMELEQWDAATDAVERVIDSSLGETSRLVGAIEYTAGVIAEG